VRRAVLSRVAVQLCRRSHGGLRRWFPRRLEEIGRNTARRSPRM